MEQSDSELVAAFNGGDQGALALLYDRYADRLFGFCFSMLRDRDEAADAVQDTIIKASQKLDQLRDPTRLRSWLFAIARNEVISRTRQRARLDDREVPEMAAELPEMEQGIASTEIQTLVWEAAAGLQPRDRELLELHLREGLDGDDLAAVLGVKTSHLHVLMSRMRDRMEKSMGSLLVARLGRDDCEDLDELLAQWDGTFSLDVRSKVTRHIEKCDVCKKKRAAVLAPSTLASAMPLILAPAALRERTLSTVFSGGSTPATAGASQGWGWQPNGFPEPLSYSTSKAASNVAWWAVAAGMILFVGAVIGAIAALGGSTDGDELTLIVPQPSPTATEVPTATPEPAAEPTAEATATAAPTPTVAAPTPTPEATPTPGAPSVPGATSVPTATAPPAEPTATPTPRPPGLGVASGVLDFGATSVEQRATITNSGDLPLSWTATVTGAGYSLGNQSGEVAGGGSGTVVVRVDRTEFGEGDIPGQLTIRGPAGQSVVVQLQGSVEVPPVFLFAFVSPSSMQADGATCGPNQATVQAELTDDSGISSVVARFAPNGAATTEVTMSPGGGPLWTGMISGVQNGATPSLTVTVVATDTRGNQATSVTSIIITPCT